MRNLSKSHINLPHFLHPKQPPVGQDLLIIDASPVQEVIDITLDRVRPVTQTSTLQNTTHNRQTKTPPMGFESAFSAREPQQTLA